MIDIRDFDRFLERTKVKQGMGVAEYDDSFQSSSDQQFYVAFWCDTDDVDDAEWDVDMLCSDAEDKDDEFAYNGVWDILQESMGFYVKAQFSYNG